MRSDVGHEFSFSPRLTIGRDLGIIDYVLWSTFKPEDLDLDQELTMECIDGGMVLFKEPLEPETIIQTTLPETFEQAFNRPYTKSSCVMLCCAE